MPPAHQADFDVDAFLDAPGALLDVRSPSEFGHAHVPGAFNLPLFDDDERAAVGTAYKTKGPDEAMRLGLGFAGAKMRSYVERAQELAASASASSRPDGVRVYCWRGGMRSEAIAWLLAFSGLRVARLVGGYKAFRRRASAELARARELVVLGGRTGAGKTDLLHALRAHGEQVLDLEGLARHRGSAFGHLMQDPQPGQQMFENLVAEALRIQDPERRCFVEDESRNVGTCVVPAGLWERMRASRVVFLDVPRSERLARGLRDYGGARAGDLLDSVARIRRRLGSQRAERIEEAVAAGDLGRAVDVVLEYYDRKYDNGLARRAPGQVLPVERPEEDLDVRARALLAAVDALPRWPGAATP